MWTQGRRLKFFPLQITYSIIRIANPLTGIAPDVLRADVNRFARDHGLDDIVSALQAGALVAQNPSTFEQLGLTEDQKSAIRQEVSHKWQQPLSLYLTVVLCSLGACVQGWDQTGSNGANLSFPQDFGIGAGALPAGPNNPNHDRDNWLVGLVNAAPYIASAFLGCWLSDPLNNLLARRGVIALSALILVLTPIGSALTQTWEQLLVTRLLMGLGMGLKGSTVPVFAAENAPAAIR